MKLQKSFSCSKNKAALLTLIRMFHKDFWVLKAPIESTARQKTLSIPTALLEDLLVAKDLKLLQELQPLDYAQIQQGLCESLPLFVGFMASSRQEVNDFQSKVGWEWQEDK